MLSFFLNVVLLNLSLFVRLSCLSSNYLVDDFYFISFTGVSFVLNCARFSMMLPVHFIKYAFLSGVAD